MSKKTRILTIFIAILSISAISINADRYFEIAKNIEIYTNVYKEINTHYVDDLDPSQLMRTGIDAMLESLDPYTNYISESQVEYYRLSTEGKYNGIGSVIRKIDDYVTIVETYDESPALKAGLKIGDQITAINGKSTKGKDNAEVIQIVRGFPGTEIEFTVKRPGEESLKKFNLVRDEVNVPNVPFYSMVSDNVGYISLTTFTANAGKNVAKALKKLKKDNSEMAGVILDLRNNGGGLLSEAINVSNVFVPKEEMVVSTKGKVKDRDQFYKTRNNPEDLDIPVAVLTNKRSASASEIVSGVLQDFDRGVILGQRTYGKGLVQNTKEVGYNSRVKLTISKYYIPSGRCIQSVEYENGEPKDIPDDQRAVFYTKNKRKVLDGGGITPDIKISLPKLPDVVKEIQKQSLIFKYANQYYLAHEVIDTVGEFSFKKYDDFVKFVENANFEFKSTSENQISELLAETKEEGLEESLLAELESVKKQIIFEKSDDLIEHKDLLVDLIEEEIVGRYFYKKGKIQQSLEDDPEVMRAVALLNDKEEYKSILQ
jgi:carboxyl-terminal processing protease